MSVDQSLALRQFWTFYAIGAGHRTRNSTTYTPSVTPTFMSEFASVGRTPAHDAGWWASSARANVAFVTRLLT